MKANKRQDYANSSINKMNRVTSQHSLQLEQSRATSVP